LNGRSRGFTIIELVVVIVILGVLAVSVMPRFLGANDVKGAGYREQLVTALRYAHKSAISHRRLVCAQLSGTGVVLTIAQNAGATSCNTNLSGPSGSGQLVANPDGFALSPSPSTLYFQASGQVTSDGAGSSVVSTTFTVTGQTPFTVEGRTGYVG